MSKGTREKAVDGFKQELIRVIGSRFFKTSDELSECLQTDSQLAWRLIGKMSAYNEMTRILMEDGPLAISKNHGEVNNGRT